jgi:hypothetical protein
MQDFPCTTLFKFEIGASYGGEITENRYQTTRQQSTSGRVKRVVRYNFLDRNRELRDAKIPRTLVSTFLSEGPMKGQIRASPQDHPFAVRRRLAEGR